MDKKTYSLVDELNSINYYRTIDDMTIHIRDYANTHYKKMLDGYEQFLKTSNLMSNSREETILEILCIGVLWYCYNHRIKRVKQFNQSLLQWIAKFRRKSLKLKPIMNKIKGILITTLVGLDINKNSDMNYSNSWMLTQSKFNGLIKYLNATDEYEQEVKRLRHWQNYLRGQNTKEFQSDITDILTLSRYFIEYCDVILSTYVSDVDIYLKYEQKYRKWQEDYLFTGKRKQEYYLNMVGAGLMNQGFRQSFHNTSKKMVLLPTCMRSKSLEECQSVGKDDWFVCKQCEKNCQVGMITEGTKDLDVEVIMVGHSSSISSQKNDTRRLDPGIGVVGVSCVLNLISGGWMLRERGIPAQCVLLDYCGCKNHWHEEGITTSLNLTYLKELLE